MGHAGTVDVIGIPGVEIRAASHRLMPYLEEFTENGRYTTGDIVDQIETGDRQCWLVVNGKGIRAVALTKISAERIKTCWITHLTGEGLREWQAAFNEVEAWARHIGCNRIEAIARPGYARIGKRYGLKQTHVVLTKELV